MAGRCRRRARWARLPGTTVEVWDLFYNLPARRKFLKSDGAGVGADLEDGDAARAGVPGDRFHAHQRGPARDASARLSGFCRIGSISSTGTARTWSKSGSEAAGIRVFGRVAALAEQGPKRGPQNIFVNRRTVKDKTIAHAIIEAYAVASVKERSPEVHLFIEMAPDEVDVNVHPTKAEVRFRNQSVVHEAVRRALAAALGQGPAPELQLRGEAVAVAEPVARSFPGLLGGIYPNRWAPVPVPQKPAVVREESRNLPAGKGRGLSSLPRGCRRNRRLRSTDRLVRWAYGR